MNNESDYASDTTFFQTINNDHPRITCLGGGHGLHATLLSAKLITEAITAIVTVADDGGSSGRIRSELGIIPPGDLRMAMAALMPNESQGSSFGDVYASVLQHRFGGNGALTGHPVGNLLLAGLTEMLGDPVLALTLLGRHFGIVGRVLPMSTIPLEIEADVSGLVEDPRITTKIRGQVAVATTLGKVRRVHLTPDNPPAPIAAVKAILRSDLVTLGPGSWFSSVIPHLLVPDLLKALHETSARRVLILNLSPEVGETSGYTAERHLHVLNAHAQNIRIDDIIVDPRSTTDTTSTEHLFRTAEQLGAKVHIIQVAQQNETIHDPALLSAVFTDLIKEHKKNKTKSA